MCRKSSSGPTGTGARGSEDDIVEIVRESIEPIKDTLGLTGAAQ